MSRFLLKALPAFNIRRTFTGAQGLLSVVCLSLVFFLSTSNAQQLTGTLSGIATDQSGAPIPNADVTLKNADSGDTRQTVSNSTGNFSITAVQPGNYSLTVSASGFNPWQINGIAMSQGDNRTIPNITLRVGSASASVDVVSGADAIVPVDTGDVSTTLNNQMVTELALQGRDAGELVKLMPGMALNNGLTQGSSFNARVVGTNSGPVGAYSANGQQPNGSMAYMLDGANLVDPGNQGTQIANINQDMTAEIKVQTSGYSAEYAKGPVVFQAFSKSGASQFHGEGYLYARNSMFNSQDSFQKNQGLKKPDDYYYYPGGNIGGPVLLPFTHFNRNRDKLFFWFGYEYMRQQPAGTLHEYFVPTADMRAGNFSPSVLNPLKAAGVNGQAIAPPCPPGSAQGSCGTLTFPGGIIPSTAFDPNGLALLSLYPKPNADPATHGGNNYLYLDQYPHNRWEQTEKVDYSITENTKLSVSYAHQSEVNTSPQAVWWAPTTALPYPSAIAANQKADELTVNFTHVINPTLTNETVATLARFINPNQLTNPSASDRSTINLSAQGLFGHTAKQIPNILSWGGGLAGFYAQSFGGSWNGGAFGGLKESPAIYDNLTKVTGTHTLKFGVYWDQTENLQSNGGFNQGVYEFETYGATSTGNTIADLLIGHAQSYSQANAIPTQTLYFHQYSAYAQDSWKISRRLTMNYGFRLDHEGQWYNNTTGFAVWLPSTYSNAVNGPTNTGLSWHSLDKSIPKSGFKSPWAYFDPRIGAAYDVFDTGKTVLRGGFAVYRYQIGVVGGASDTASGAFTYGTNALTSLAQASTFNPPATQGANGGTIYPYQLNDGRVPRTYNYNFTISQATPWKGVFEISYVGNHSMNGVIQGGNSHIGDQNIIPMGAYYRPDPLSTSKNYGQIVSPTASNFQGNDYYPLVNYQSIYLISHGSYANYNSLQVAWQKQSGPVTFLTNYTFGKALGIRDGNTANGSGAGALVDSFSLKNNYGVLAYDHTQVFNAGYVWHLPNPLHGNKILSGTVNGWELSGTTQFQTGAPIQPNTGGNLNATYPTGVSNSVYFGTNALQLQPALTCDPRSGLKSDQYYNPSCFTLPALGPNGTSKNGPTIWPYIKGPAYFNSDLSLYKNFKVTERQNVQLRFAAFNFLNHPLRQFNADGTNNDLRLTFASGGTTNSNARFTGYPEYTVGNRLIELAVKYMF